MESPRRSGIPVPKSSSRPLMRKSLSKSTEGLFDADDTHNSDLDVFTLLEENISLKEKTEALLDKNNAVLQRNVQLERDNTRMCKQLEELKIQQKSLKQQLENLMDKCQREINEGQTIQNIQEQQKKIINDLMIKVRIQEEKHVELLEVGKQAKNKLKELVPEINRTEKKDEKEKCDIVTAETVEKLITEIGNIKTQLNNTELQLYEANEKISDLIETHQHIQEENESLKVENSNLTKVAQLMTHSMKESVDTSKRMEEALIEMRKRNDELLRANKDATDSPVAPRFLTTNEQVLQLKDELNRREVAHNERIVEMNKLMENAIQTNTNDEIQVLQIKLEMVEKELQFALERAEKAEQELEQFKQLYNNSSCSNLNSNNVNRMDASTLTTPTIENSEIEIVRAPPPPPPPMPKFNFTPANFAPFGTTTTASSLSDGIASISLNNTRQNIFDENNQQVKQQPQQATGMDALIAQLRDGSVTLRRNRRKTQNNAALQEMFDVLEASRRQNRTSKIVIDSQTNIVKLSHEKF